MAIPVCLCFGFLRLDSEQMQSVSGIIWKIWAIFRLSLELNILIEAYFGRLIVYCIVFVIRVRVLWIFYRKSRITRHFVDSVVSILLTAFPYCARCPCRTNCSKAFRDANPPCSCRCNRAGAHAEKTALGLPVASSTTPPAADASAKGAHAKQTTEKQSVSQRPKSTAAKRKRKTPCLTRLFRRMKRSRPVLEAPVRVATVYT